MDQLTIQRAFDLALQHHHAGRLREAERLYRLILAQKPDLVEASHLLGLIAHQAGKNEIAAGLIRRAVELKPDYVDAQYNLGVVLEKTGDLAGAIAAFRRTIDLDPNNAAAFSSLGNALGDKGELEEAAAACRRAIALKPAFADPHIFLGNALWSKGLHEEAIASYRRAAALDPNRADIHSILGAALRETGQLDEAIVEFRRAISLNGGLSEGYNNLGNALRAKGQFDEAIAACRQAIALDPGFAEACMNLGNALRDKSQLDEAIIAYRQAVALKPNYAEAYNNLGVTLKDTGKLEEALAAYSRAIEIKPGFAEAHSNLIYMMHFCPRCDAHQIAEEQRRWNRQYALREPQGGTPPEPQGRPARSVMLGHDSEFDPDRRLRIGYVSPDFRDHVVGRNLLPLFRRHNRREVEIFCYSQARGRDAWTDEFQKNSDCWREISGLTDEQVAIQIREDRIDVLVDLALHMSNNRLSVFARKPAPVQATFAGYPGSTGLSTIDYRLSDPYLDPVRQGSPQAPGADESVHAEQIIRLPDSFWCYDPLDCRDVTVNSLPALQEGAIAFGCLGQFCKINDDILAIWAEVLRQAKGSRLLLSAHPGSHRRRTEDFLLKEGIGYGRVEFVPPLPRRQYLEVYHRIDVGLDSFPYNGHTTSLDSFWMGVPVVTLVGSSAVSRAGWSQLSNLGLTELAAQTPEQFAGIAADLADDLPRLKELRSTLRTRMEQSPLMDASKFARNVEAAFRAMWRKWCEST